MNGCSTIISIISLWSGGGEWCCCHRRPLLVLSLLLVGLWVMTSLFSLFSLIITKIYNNYEKYFHGLCNINLNLVNYNANILFKCRFFHLQHERIIQVDNKLDQFVQISYHLRDISL